LFGHLTPTRWQTGQSRRLALRSARSWRRLSARVNPQLAQLPVHQPCSRCRGPAGLSVEGSRRWLPCPWPGGATPPGRTCTTASRASTYEDSAWVCRERTIHSGQSQPTVHARPLPADGPVYRRSRRSRARTVMSRTSISAST
jgi:hypothetical protein